MKNSVKTVSFLDRVESIQVKFMESLITGQRDAIFGETGRDEAHDPLEAEDGDTSRANPALD